MIAQRPLSELSSSALRGARSGRSTRFACSVLATMLGIAFVSPVLLSHERTASAGDVGAEASDHFKRGVEFSKDGDFEAALVEFKRAYELQPNFRVLYNLGQTSRELRDYAGALRSFEQYLKEGGVDAPKRDKVEAWVEELKGKVATIAIKVNVPGAEVAIDDVSVGASPIKDPVIVNAGKRKVSATLSGYTPLQKYVDLAGTDSKTVALELSPLAAPNGGDGKGGKPGGGDTHTEPPRKSSPGPWIALAGTGAAAVATGIFGGLALSAKSDFNKALGTFPGNSKDIEAKRSKARTFAATADVLGGVTGAGAVVTIVLFATRPSAPKEESAAKKEALAPSLGIGFGSLQVSGQF